MKVNFPIFIPTKKRFDNCTFVKFLHNRTDCDVYIVVEHEDLTQYMDRYPRHNYIVLPESNQGIAYVRNYIRAYTMKQNIHRFWMCDDDITGFFRREDKKMVKCEMLEAMNFVERCATENKNVGQAGLEYQQLAWSSEVDFKLNGYCDVCVLIDNILVPEHINYRPEVALKEDRDFTMQIIHSEVDTLRVCKYGFAAPKNGSNAGGLKEMAYDVTGREEKAVDKMIEVWGEQICGKIEKPDGRIDVKIRWREIRSKQISLF